MLHASVVNSSAFCRLLCKASLDGCGELLGKLNGAGGLLSLHEETNCEAGDEN